MKSGVGKAGFEGTLLSKAGEAFLSSPIKEEDLTRSLRFAFEGLGIRTYGDLLRVGYEEIRSTHGVGEGALCTFLRKTQQRAESLLIDGMG